MSLLCNCGDVFESKQGLVLHLHELRRHEANLDEKQQNGGSTSFLCPIPTCKKGATGIVPHMQHLSSSKKHKRNCDLFVRGNYATPPPPPLSGASVQSDAVPGDDLFLMFCHVCDFETFQSEQDYLKHVEDADDTHCRTLVATYPDINRMECPICNVSISGFVNYKDHMRSRKHKNRVTQPKSRINVVPSPQPQPQEREDNDNDDLMSEASYESYHTARGSSVSSPPPSVCEGAGRVEHNSLEESMNLTSSDDDDIPYPGGRHLAVIISNEFPNDPDYSPRKGSEKDVTLIQETLKPFGFNFQIERNLNKKQTFDFLKAIRDDLNADKDRYASLAVFVLSHGNIDVINAASDPNNPEEVRDFEIYDLPGFFSSSYCPALVGKPKLFFPNACRGQGFNEARPTVEADGSSSKTKTDHPPVLPDIADFIICYPTVQFMKAWR